MDTIQIWANNNGRQMSMVSLGAQCLWLCNGWLSLRRSLIAGEGGGPRWLLLLEEEFSVQRGPAVDTGPESAAGGPAHLPRYYDRAPGVYMGRCPSPGGSWLRSWLGVGEGPGRTLFSLATDKRF